MSLPKDSDIIKSDIKISSDKSIHESDIDFIDDSDVSSESSDETSDEFQDNNCTTFMYIAINC